MYSLFVLSFIGLVVAGIYEMYRKNGDLLLGFCIFLSNLLLLWTFIR